MAQKTDLLSLFVRELNEATPCKDENDLKLMTYFVYQIIITARKHFSKRQYLKIVAALPYSARLHEGQYRKDGITPYLLHLLEVACILIDLRVFDYQVICAAILHDTVELEKEMSDATKRKKEISVIFGVGVMTIVNLLSKRPQEDPGIMWRRMLREKNRNILWRVLVIKYADRIHNARTFAAMPSMKIDEKVVETKIWFPRIKRRLSNIFLYLWKKRTLKEKKYLKLPEKLDGLLMVAIKPYETPLNLDPVVHQVLDVFL